MTRPVTTSGKHDGFVGECLALMVISVLAFLFLATRELLTEDGPRYVKKDLPRHMAAATNFFLLIWLFPWSS